MELRLVPAVLALSFFGCPGPAPGEGEGDLGEGEGEGEGDLGAGEGEGEGEEGEGEGDSGEGEGEGEEPGPCLSATALSPGVTVAGTTVDGVSGAALCDELVGAGPDVAFSVVLNDEQGLIVQATPAPDSGDLVVSVFDDASCAVDSALALPAQHCRLSGLDPPRPAEVRLGALPPGTYFIVVESTDPAGADFSVGVDVVDPFCAGDLLDIEGDDLAAGATLLGNGNVDDAGEAVGAGGLVVCTGDSDFFLFGHIGGSLVAGVDFTDPDGDDESAGAANFFAADVDVAATRSDGVLRFTPGAAVGTTPLNDADRARGFYLVEVSSDGRDLGLAGLGQVLHIEHGCTGDALDVPLAELDDDAERGQLPAILPPPEPVARSVCADDVDLIDMAPLFAGELDLVIGGPAASTVDVGLFTVASTGEETVLPFTRTVDGEAVLFTADIANPALQVRARVSALSARTDQEFTWTFRSPALEAPPDNDTCGGAVVLVDGAEPVVGKTVGAGPDYASSCSVDPTAADVFFRFHLDAAAGVALDITEGIRLPFFTVLPLPPSGLCPANLDDLVPIQQEGPFGTFDLCVDAPGRLRLRSLPAGDFLVVADDAFAGGGGIFTVGLGVFPGGFPAACAAPQAIVPPLRNAAPSTLRFTGADFFFDTLDAAGLTTRGDERVLSFTASESGVLTARTIQQPAASDSDTVLSLRDDACTNEAGEVADDDGESSAAVDPDDVYDSILTVPVVAGVTYFLVIDHFFAGAPALDDVVEVELLLTP